MFPRSLKPLLLAVAGLLLLSAEVHAYIGPGAGLGMIGSLVALVGAVVVALVGIVIFPLRLILKKKRAKDADKQDIAKTK